MRGTKNKLSPTTGVRIILWLLVVTGGNSLMAQERPPIPVEVEVRTAQFLNFGTFTVGPGGGTVMVDPNGSRTKTGDVFLLGNNSSYAIFDVFANPGTIIQVQEYGDVELTGPAGSSVTLRLNLAQDISTGRTFITTAAAGFPNPVFVGGTLTIPNGESAKAGSYNGQLRLNFIHQ